MTKKKTINKGLIILLILFMLYLVMLYSKGRGYYDYKEYNKMLLTKEAMERFEEDIKNNEKINIKDYINYNETDYSNAITKLGSNIGKGSKNLITKGFSKMFKFLGKFFT